MEQFLSDRSAERTDSKTGSSKGNYASEVVDKCVQQGVNLKDYGRTSLVEEVPKASQSVEAMVVPGPQTSGDDVLVVPPTPSQGVSLQDTILNVGQVTPENVPEEAPPVDSGKGRKRKALLSVDNQETVTRLFGKKGSMQILSKDDDVFDDIQSDFGA